MSEPNSTESDRVESQQEKRLADDSALRDREEMFQLLVEASSQIVWVTDAEGTVVEDSPSWRDFTGQTREEWLGKGWLNAIHPDHQSATLEAWQEVVREGGIFSIEYKLRHRSGSYRWTLARGVPQKAADGSIKRWVGMNTDIDAQKVAELEMSLALQTIAEREQQLHSLISSTAEGIYGIDRSGNCKFANEACVKLLGYQSIDDLLGKQMHQLIHHTTGDGLPLANEDCSIYQAFRAGIRVHVDDEVFWRSDGSSFDVEFWSYPETQHGEIVGAVVTFLDITERKRWEMELTDREAHLRRVINNQLGLVGIIGQHGRLLDVDDRSMSIAGLTRDDVIGKQFSECGWWTYREDVQNQIRAAMERAFAGKKVRFDVGLFSKEGQPLMIDFMLAPVFGDDGYVEYLIPSGVDISDRAKIEQEQRETAARLEAIFNSAVDGIITSDRNGIIDSVNIAASEIFGFEVEEMVGQSLKMLMRKPDRDRHERSLARYAETGERRIIGTQQEVTGQRKDGSTFPLELAVSETTLENDHRFVGVVRDITDRVAADQAQQDYANRLSMALSSGGMAAWEWTPTESFWDEALYNLLGLSKELTASTELFFSVVHPEDIDKLSTAWQSAVDGLQEYHCEFRIKRADGSVRWIVGMGEVVKDHAGNVKRVYGLNWDSTQDHQNAEALRESEQRAQRANQSKSEFLANMSHEIRTPMTSIIGYAELLSESVRDPEAQQHLQTIRRNGNFLLEIINDILDLSKIEAGKFEVDCEPFAPHLMVEEVCSILGIRAAEKALQLETEFTNSLPATINSDPKRVRQILINLIGNAIKFTKRGRVQVRVEFLPGHNPQIRFRIQDTGIGMSPNQLTALFEPFHQGDASVTRAFGGTGLGLAISKRLAAMLGGNIDVETSLGQGSEFTLTLGTGDVSQVPFVDSKQMSQPATPLDVVRANTDASQGPIALDCHILLVDDRRDVRFLSNRILKKSGARITEAEDGQLALAAVADAIEQNDPFDLILLDMQMPNMDGYETASELREQGFVAPIVALTADAMQGDMKRCLESGCNDYLSKPIDATKLIEMVAKMIGQRE